MSHLILIVAIKISILLYIFVHIQITDYWLPTIQEVTAEGTQKPIVLVGNKVFSSFIFLR